jgi:hypothetical protein
MSAQGWERVQQLKLRKESKQQYTKDMSNKTERLKIECCGSYGQLPTEKETKQKFADF